MDFETDQSKCNNASLVLHSMKPIPFLGDSGTLINITTKPFLSSHYNQSAMSLYSMSSASSVCSSISSRYDSGYESSDSWFLPDMEDEYVDDAWKFVVKPQDFIFELELNANIFKPHIKQHFIPRKEIVGEQSSTSPLIPTVSIQMEMDVCPLSPPPSPNEKKEPVKPYLCEHCPSTFSRNHDLKRHLRIHLGVRPYKCNTCSKTFTRMDALHRHESVAACKREREL